MNFKCLRDHVQLNPLFKSWNLLKINEIYELEIAKFMHLYDNKHLPESFDHSLNLLAIIFLTQPDPYPIKTIIKKDII